MPHASRDAQAADRPAAGLPGAALLRVAALMALLYVFLFAIALLGTAFKAFGDDFGRALIAGTSNPVVGLLIGLLATSLVQSSSGTTSIIVGMVAAGALTVRGAVPIIMGANMGTTITNTIVAMGAMGRRAEFRRAFAGATMHDFFNLLTILLLFPLEQGTHYLERAATWLSSHLVGARGVEFEGPVKAITAPPADALRELLIGRWHLHGTAAAVLMLIVSLVLLFGALVLLTGLMRRVVMARAEGVFNDYLQRNGMLGMLVGLVVTVMVQSSSITTSLLVPLIGAGIVQLEAAFAVTLGANIGTTVTALLASLAGNGAAVTVALVHLMFNLTGTLIFYPLPALRRIPVRLARLLALAACRNRLVALYYVLGVFFAMPLLFIAVSRALGGAR